MRKLIVKIPENYTRVDIDETKFKRYDPTYDDMYNILVANDLVSINKYYHPEVYTILLYKDQTITPQNLNKINLFVVDNLKKYEELSAKHNINRQKIYILEQDNLVLERKINNFFREIFNTINIHQDSKQWKSSLQTIKVIDEANSVVFKSKLDRGQHAYVEYSEVFGIDNKSSYIITNKMCIQDDIECQIFLVSYNRDKTVDTFVVDANTEKVFNPCKEAECIKISLRLKGEGQVSLERIKILLYTQEEAYDTLVKGIEEEHYLILTNVYPNDQNLYRNGFVHRRVINYKERHLNVDVFSCNSRNRGLEKYKFDGIDVYGGDEEALKVLIKKNKYRKILVHFVNENMVKAIEEIDSTLPLVVWIHGFETERWQRRNFNYTEEEIAKNRSKWEKEDEQKMRFMKRIYTDAKNTFVFVSRWFMEAVGEEDAGCKVTNYEIIPNVVDGEIFKFIPKGVEQRKKILTIRPFASKKYANDLTVKAILELSKQPYFEELSFDIYGRGPLFDEILEPVRNFANVHIHETFLTQEEIAKAHKTHGIFICPTRLDAQGVSMCEAMSSGLIPVTNGVTAIPEYVNEGIGVLAPENDHKILAEGIEQLYHNPQLFKEMSQRAYEEIQQQCGVENVIEKEIECIKRS